MLRLLTRNAIPSTRLLRDALINNYPQIKKAYVTKDASRINRNDVVIRYGNSDRINGIESGFNSVALISLCANKKRFSEFAEENKFYSPIYNKHVPQNDDFPLIIRETMFGFGGQGIVICRNINDFKTNWNRNYYWTRFVLTDFELRIHIINGEIIKIFRKELENEDDLPIRNNHSCHFSLRDANNYSKLKTEVETLCSIPPFNKGIVALDVGWDSKNKRYFIFEANSSPGLNENTANDYALKIGDHILELL